MPQSTPTPEMTAEELVAAVEGGDEIHLLDVRAPFRLESGRIDILPEGRFHNIQGSKLLALEDPLASGLDPAKRLAVVCGVGSDSRKIAEYLNGHGFNAASITRGISGWMEATVARELAPPESLDRLVQFDRIGKGALGYVLVSDGHAVILDPPRHTVRYLETIDAASAKLAAVADTHAHADYISGSHLLALLEDVPYRLHPADAVYPYDGTPGRIAYEAVAEGSTIRFGRAELRVVCTPGHTEGSVTYRLGDDLAFTGDFLFVASVGRPDLGGKTDEWTKVLWKSIERAKREWPKGMRVLPAHYASAAERNGDHSVGRTFGELLSTNGPLRMKSEAEFTAWVKSKAGKFPEAYKTIKAINVGLKKVSDLEAEELEAGKNECALG